MARPSTELADEVVELLDGTDLASKVGPTILLASAEPKGWPHLALLSVGEVLAVSATELRLALHSSSGTTAALSATGRGLLSLVVGGVTHRIRIDSSPIETHDPDGLRLFRAQVVRCDQDVVGYAEVLHGIEFALVDPAGAVERWERQIERLRTAQE